MSCPVVIDGYEVYQDDADKVEKVYVSYKVGLVDNEQKVL